MCKKNNNNHNYDVRKILMLTKRYILFFESHLIFTSCLCLASSSLLCKVKRCTGKKVSSDFLPTATETGVENNNGRGSFVLTEVGLNAEGTHPFAFKWHWLKHGKKSWQTHSFILQMICDMVPQSILTLSKEHTCWFSYLMSKQYYFSPFHSYMMQWQLDIFKPPSQI